MFTEQMRIVLNVYVFFFVKQKTSYEMRISDWSSDVCSSDLERDWPVRRVAPTVPDYGSETHFPRRNRRRRLRCGPVGSNAAAAHRSRRDSPSRSEARRVGKECVSTFRSRWSPFH